MKISQLTLITCTAMALMQMSCTTRSTVHSRVASYPDYFEKLSDKHKKLVMQHRVSEGMGKEAVYLAWGTADEVKTSSRNHRTRETWTYLRYEPIYTRSINVGFGGYGGYGGGCYGRRGYEWGYPYGSNLSYGTDVTYQSHEGAKVEFEKNRVISWETVR